MRSCVIGADVSTLTLVIAGLLGAVSAFALLEALRRRARQKLLRAQPDVVSRVRRLDGPTRKAIARAIRRGEAPPREHAKLTVALIDTIESLQPPPRPHPLLRAIASSAPLIVLAVFFFHSTDSFTATLGAGCAGFWAVSTTVHLVFVRRVERGRTLRPAARAAALEAMEPFSVGEN